jgi:hypothetical protein
VCAAKIIFNAFTSQFKTGVAPRVILAPFHTSTNTARLQTHPGLNDGLIGKYLVRPAACSADAQSGRR